MYILSMLIFGTNGILVHHISLASSQIILMRTLIGGLLLTLIVLLRGGFDRAGIRADLLPLLLGGSVLGLNALIYLIIGYADGVANRGFYPDDIKFPIMFIAASDTAFLILTYLSGFLFRARFNIIHYFLNIMLPELIYTVLAAIIIYIPLRNLLLSFDRGTEDSE